MGRIDLVGESFADNQLRVFHRLESAMKACAEAKVCIMHMDFVLYAFDRTEIDELMAEGCNPGDAAARAKKITAINEHGTFIDSGLFGD